ncbi:uncharacterized protein LOC129809525 [Phlebotomus papatasi]|uniref:uncharacterized protein LOC129809525 n=1 Tax=Phlebotomus papatasi TaxID=29031 RepID=UPI00248472A9|nr:uncharacterized protein LOC129809525 [Phlebotomus papatasi]
MEPVKSVCKCPEFVGDVLVAIASRRGITKPRFSYENGSNYGDGFIGMVTRVVIVDEDSGMEIRLICKHLKHDPNDTDTFTSMDMFKREIFIYSHVLPEIVRLQLEKNIPADEGFFSFPKCHFARFSEQNQEAALIFDDLRFEGYQMLEKRQIPDVEHVKLLMRQLGRLHAVSFALREQKPEILEQFKCLDDVLTKLMRRKVMQPLAVKNCHLTQSILTPEDDMKIREFFQRWESTMWTDISETIHGENAEPYAVINHGDCWINNLMYRHDDQDKPREISVIDWQMSRYASPVLDMIYFTFTCTNKSFRDQHLHACLNLYYDSFAELLQKLGGDASRQFPKSVLEEHLKKFMKFGMAMSTFTTPLDTKYVNGYTSEGDYVSLNESNRKHYEERMRGNINYFFSHGCTN